MGDRLGLRLPGRCVPAAFVLWPERLVQVRCPPAVGAPRGGPAPPPRRLPQASSWQCLVGEPVILHADSPEPVLVSVAELHAALQALSVGGRGGQVTREACSMRPGPLTS